jgi:hypothetical protein
VRAGVRAAASALALIGLRSCIRAVLLKQYEATRDSAATVLVRYASAVLTRGALRQFSARVGYFFPRCCYHVVQESPWRRNALQLCSTAMRNLPSAEPTSARCRNPDRTLSIVSVDTAQKQIERIERRTNDATIHQKMPHWHREHP